MRVAAAQIAPVLCDRTATLAKILARCEEAATEGCRLVAFPEAVLPGYPTWLGRTGGAKFESPLQKEIHARYLEAAVELPGPELAQLQQSAGDHGLSLVVGVAEREHGTIYCTALWVHPDGQWLAHRKLVPTYEERLAWGWGDGHGLQVQDVDGWKVGALNCWENWMPAARLALYAQGEELHVSLWPGRPSLTRDHARFVSREGRVWVLACSGVLRPEDIPADFPARDQMIASAQDGALHCGVSRSVGPDQDEHMSLDIAEEELIVAELDRNLLLRERQNFDPAGHYHRPDVFDFRVDRRRKPAAEFEDESPEPSPT